MTLHRVAPAARRVVLALALVLLALGGGPSRAGADDSSVEVHLFWLATCPHCAAARAFLDDLAEEVPELVVLEHEVSSDPVAQQLFADMAAARGGEASAVPTIILEDRMWVGFDDATAVAVEAEVRARVGSAEPGRSEATRAPETREERISVPFFGDVDVGSRSILASTVVIAFVDGVNPCSLWVLSVLLALVLHSGSRRRVALVGSVFLAVTTALYGLYIVGAYSLLSYASYLPWIQRVVALVVAAFALVNLRDYFRVEPATLSIPATAKPGIYRRARSLIGSDRSWLGVVGGTAVLAAGVSLVETPCSAALPLLWTNLLNEADTTTAAAVTLFALYMAIFLVDELVLFGAAVVTMRATRLQDRHGRALRLVTGSVMLCLGVVMLVDPTLLDTIGGTLAVLAATAVLAVVLAAVGRRWGPLATS